MAEWKNAKTCEEGRHHVDESLIQKAVRGTVMLAGFMPIRITCRAKLTDKRKCFILKALRYL